MQSLAQNIVFRMLSYITEVAAGYNELLFSLRIAWLTPKFLPGGNGSRKKGQPGSQKICFGSRKKGHLRPVLDAS
jgi:hypothetical protein